MCFVIVFEFCVEMVNVILIFVIGVLLIYFWLENIVSVGDIVIVISLCLCFNGMLYWIMWEVLGLFENLGIV